MHSLLTRRVLSIALMLTLAVLLTLSLSACAKPSVAKVFAPEPVVVGSDYPMNEIMLPMEVLVELSNGQQVKRPVTWDTSRLPSSLQKDTTVIGTIEAGQSIEFLIMVTADLPCLSQQEMQTTDLSKAMELNLQQDLRVARVAWSRQKDQLAFVVNDEVLCLWRVGQPGSHEVKNVDARSCLAIAWSYDASCLLLNSGHTNVSGTLGCEIINVAKQQEIVKLVTGSDGIWAPDRNAVLVGVLNKETELYWRDPEYGVDLAVYDVDSRKLHILQRSDQEHDFRAVSWDEPRLAVYGIVYFNGKPSETRSFAIDVLTDAPSVPALSAAELTNSTVLIQRLQMAGLREVTLSPDGLSVAFLTAEDLYVWVLPEPTPKRAAVLGPGGSPFRHHLSWSPDGQFLAVHDGSGANITLKILRTADFKLVAEMPIYTLAYWSPDSDEMLMATASGVKPTIEFTIDYLTDLVLYDVETGKSRTLLKADGETSYRPSGWTKPGEASYELIHGRGYSPSRTIQTRP